MRYPAGFYRLNPAFRVVLTNWSVDVKILANEPHQDGNVSIKVGFECVNNGFIYFVSNPDQALAATDLSAGVFPGGMGASLDIEL